MLVSKLPPVIMWSAVAGSTVLSVAVGLVFGLQPAWRAANVDPIQALRCPEPCTLTGAPGVS